MRKMCDSSKLSSRIRFSALRRGEVVAERLLDDDARALACSPTVASCSTTGPNSAGGIAR